MAIAAPEAGTSAGIDFERSSDLIQLTKGRHDVVRWVDVGERRFLAVDGDDPPGGGVFQQAIATLYPVAYTLHFALRERGVKAPVGMLEGLYWVPPEELEAWMAADAEPPEGAPVDAGATDATASSTTWKWRLMLAVPSEATEVEVERAILNAAHRRPLPLAPLLRVIGIREGPSAQIVHLGAYDAEAPTLRVLHGAIAAAGYQPRGPHHEIYLNDPRQVGEAKAKTLLRQPVVHPD